MLLTIIVFVLILGVLIFVHECGHFLTAKRNGIKADEFGFGFPPRIFGFYKNEKTGKYEFVPGSREVESKNTVYSVNWLPLGGFVKIKGENGEGKDEEDSFASKSAWKRTKVLAAGVVMNFVLAWILISIGFMIGAPQEVTAGMHPASSKIQITAVAPNSPAAAANLQAGDEVLKNQTSPTGQTVSLRDVTSLQNYIDANKGQLVDLEIKRGATMMDIKVTPRMNPPQDQGALGIELTETTIVGYPWYRSIWMGVTTTVNLTWAILVAFGGIIASLFAGKGVGADVAGPIGIYTLTGQVTAMGLVYVLQFAALLSIN
ncbi:MAG: site-2 protease family protein, partial [Candidatus Pacebacteria bacterium]|nr:site-2 protease family protein [Candidatus Paceibacterota bacterium]